MVFPLSKTSFQVLSVFCTRFAEIPGLYAYQLPVFMKRKTPSFPSKYMIFSLSSSLPR
jgi:hypothetical protein